MGEVVESTERKRKVRKDKGRVFLTERDEWVLEWIGEMMVVRADQLQRLLGRKSGVRAKQEGVIGEKAAKQVIERWKKLGLADSDKFFHKEPECIWLTKKGLDALDLPYKKAFNGKITLLRHYYWVNEVRLWVENAYGDEARWISERRLFVQQENTSGHYVDGVVESGDERAAIEVEITIKSVKDAGKILTALADKYDNIWYFTNKETHGSVVKRVNSLPTEVKESFVIRSLEELI